LLHGPPRRWNGMIHPTEIRAVNLRWCGVDYEHVTGSRFLHAWWCSRTRTRLTHWVHTHIGKRSTTPVSQFVTEREIFYVDSTGSEIFVRLGSENEGCLQSLVRALSRNWVGCRYPMRPVSSANFSSALAMASGSLTRLTRIKLGHNHLCLCPVWGCFPRPVSS
jgi:hypothetical protein